MTRGDWTSGRFTTVVQGRNNPDTPLSHPIIATFTETSSGRALFTDEYPNGRQVTWFTEGWNVSPLRRVRGVPLSPFPSGSVTTVPVRATLSSPGIGARDRRRSVTPPRKSQSRNRSRVETLYLQWSGQNIYSLVSESLLVYRPSLSK